MQVVLILSMSISIKVGWINSDLSIFISFISTLMFVDHVFPENADPL